MWSDLKYYSTDILNNQMQDCLEAENYIHCARIRDELARRNKRNKFDDTVCGKIRSFILYVGAVLVFIIVISWVITSIGNWINSLFS